MTPASTPNTMVTRCPKCNTAFRITAAQLESAKGAVRCGSCLHVFKAQSHLVNKPGNSAPALDSSNPTHKPSSSIANIAKTVATPKPVSAPKAEAAKPIAKPKTTPPQKNSASLKKHDDDDQLISDDMDDKSSGNSRYEFEGFMDVDLATKTQTSSLFERKIKDEPEDKIQDNSDESWAENLMDDDDDTPQIGMIKTQVAPKAKETANQEPKKHESAKQESAQTAAQEEKNKLVFNLPHDDSSDDTEYSQYGKYASNFSATDEFELSDELSRIPNAKSKQSITEEKEEIINAIPVAGIFHDDDFDESANKRQLKIEPKIRSYDGSRAGLLKNIIPAPLEFTANNIGYWYYRILWPVLALLALASIILQLAYFRFDHYARIQPYRDFYAFACPMVGCTLPTLVDKKQIVTYNLVVQAHDDVENAILVDVMLLNKAGFEQAFPDLLLSFSDMDGVVKASRRFIPEDYLGGELAGKKFMPSKQPIHINLEIKDPKVDNYKMDVL